MNIREYTKIEHENIEKLPLVQSLINGTISKQAYNSYLNQRYYIFECLEIENVMPTNLRRAPKILKDITKKVKPIKTLEEYIDKLVNYESPDDKVFHGHMYVNYLGDLYGGQIIKKNLKFSANHLEFKNPEKCVAFIRSLKLDDPQVMQEAKQAYVHLSKIYTEIYYKTMESKNVSLCA